MTEQLRKAVHEKKSEITLSGKVEYDEVHVNTMEEGFLLVTIANFITAT